MAASRNEALEMVALPWLYPSPDPIGYLLVIIVGGVARRLALLIEPDELQADQGFGSFTLMRSRHAGN